MQTVHLMAACIALLSASCSQTARQQYSSTYAVVENAPQTSAPDYKTAEPYVTRDTNYYNPKTYAPDTNYYTPKTYASGTNYYNPRTYASGTNYYNPKAYAPDTNYYNPKTYAPDTNYYNPKTYASDTNYYNPKTYAPDTNYYTPKTYASDTNYYNPKTYAPDTNYYNPKTYASNAVAVKAQTLAGYPATIAGTRDEATRSGSAPPSEDGGLSLSQPTYNPFSISPSETRIAGSTPATLPVTGKSYAEKVYEGYKTLSDSPAYQGANLVIKGVTCTAGVLAAPDSAGLSLAVTAKNCVQAGWAAHRLGTQLGQ